MMDALRPDHLGPWGSKRRSRPTPNFSRMADEGVFFRNCFSHMPSSHPSRASILTGRDPHTHGVRINSRPLAASETTLAQILQEAGYQTATTREFSPGLGRGFAERGIVRGLSAFDQGPWDVVTDVPEMAEEEAATDVAQDVAAIVEWLERRAVDPTRVKTPFFMWGDIEDTHEPWRPPVPFDTMHTSPDYAGPDVSCPPMYSPDLTPEQVDHAVGLYDGVVSLLDKHLGILLDALDRLGLSENTLLIVMSDHGVHLGEHSLWRKPPTLFDTVLRATLMMRMLGTLPAGVQSEGLGLVNDVFATTLDVAGLTVPEAAAGHCVSLGPLWNGAAEVRDFVPLEFNSYKGTAAKGIRTEKWKYFYYRSVGDITWDTMAPGDIWSAHGWPLTMLFDLENDPDEMIDVAAKNPDVVVDMHRKLLEWLIDSENDLPVREVEA